MSPLEAATAVALLQANWPEARWTEATIGLYELMLRDLDADVARTAIERVIRTSKFLPKVSEILDEVADLTMGQARSGVEAWGDVCIMIRRDGSYGTPKFTDPLVEQCVRMMGWRNLCLGESPEAADRARFCELYEDLQRKQRKFDVCGPPRLPGREAPALNGDVGKLLAGIGGKAP